MIKHAFYKNLGLSIILISNTLLIGCNMEVEKTASIEEIKDNQCSELYCNEINDLINEYLKYLSIVNKEDIDKSEILTISNDFLLRLNTYKLSPITKVDYQIDNYLIKFKYEIKKLIECNMKYVKENKIALMYESVNYKKDSMRTCNILINIKNKYTLKGD